LELRDAATLTTFPKPLQEKGFLNKKVNPMKKNLIVVLASVLLASCSAPKYAYKFDYHDYNAGRKEKQAAKEVASNPGPIAVQPEVLVAETDVTTSDKPADVQMTPSKPKAAPLMMSKAERKEMVKNLKATVKKMKDSRKSGDVVQTDQGTKVMDHDLKMSLVFLLIAILAGALYGVSPWLAGIVGTVAFIVAVYFFIVWLTKQ
jgi:hypothetical protein